MTPDNEVQLVKLCAFYPGCNEEINDLHKKVADDMLMNLVWNDMLRIVTFGSNRNLCQKLNDMVTLGYLLTWQKQ